MPPSQLLQPWAIVGNGSTVKGKWDTVFDKLETHEQSKRMFAKKYDKNIRSYNEGVLKAKRDSNAAALRESGVSPPPLSDEEAQLVRCPVQRSPIY